jgi:REP element-mobilizing transposase RayT
MIDIHERLEPDGFYHIYNRANGNEKIFLNTENYSFFLNQYSKYLGNLIETYSFCLLPNHFHLLVKIKSEQELKTIIDEASKTTEWDSAKFLSKQFSNFFSSYTQAFNKVQGRRGSLFMKNYKRKRINDEKYLLKLVHYIHYNPIEAGLAINLEEWKFSSYNTILSDKGTKIERQKVIDLFSDKANFIAFHKQSPSL